MKHLFWALLLFIFHASATWGQEGLKPSFEVNKKIDYLTTDRLENLYLLQKDFIWMYNAQGDSLAAFNTKKYGRVSLIDPIDPYKILVFFKDYGVVLFLDNYLSENGEAIDLPALGYDQVIVACKSRENGFWIYDQLKQKAFHLNSSFQPTHETVNLSQWFGKALQPNFMMEYNNRLYINDKETGVYVFDHFATFIKKLPILGLEQFQVHNEGLYYIDSNQYCQYNFKSFNTNCESLIDEQIKSVRIENDRLFFRKEKAVEVYKRN